MNTNVLRVVGVRRAVRCGFVPLPARIHRIQDDLYILERVRCSPHHARRAPDALRATSRSSWIRDWMRAGNGTTHGTPYAYDAHIPLVFMGPGIKAGHYDGNVALNDLAPTLATMLSVETPGGSQGRVLPKCSHPPPPITCRLPVEVQIRADDRDHDHGRVTHVDRAPARARLAALLRRDCRVRQPRPAASRPAALVA